MRGRPGDLSESYQPFLKLPGSNRMRTLPDGLWLNFGGNSGDPFVDILAIEACGSLPNLLDKRSRFAPSTQSMLAVCPVPWLLAPILSGEDTPRWRMTGVLRREPVVPLVIPVRDMRVLYGLKLRHYQGFASSQVPHPHEYFLPMHALTAENGHEEPALRALLSRASTTSNFLGPLSADPEEASREAGQDADQAEDFSQDHAMDATEMRPERTRPPLLRLVPNLAGR